MMEHPEFVPGTDRVRFSTQSAASAATSTVRSGSGHRRRAKVNGPGFLHAGTIAAIADVAIGTHCRDEDPPFGLVNRQPLLRPAWLPTR